MASVKEAFGTSNQAITITLTTQANNNQRSSAAIDNTTNLYDDALVSVKIVSTNALAGYVNVYAYGTTDGGTTYGGGEASMGTDASVTLSSPPNINLIGVVNCAGGAGTYWKTAMSVASAFGGVLPDHWGIVVENKSGVALTAGSAANYQGVTYTVA